MLRACLALPLVMAGCVLLLASRAGCSPSVNPLCVLKHFRALTWHSSPGVFQCKLMAVTLTSG